MLERQTASHWIARFALGALLLLGVGSGVVARLFARIDPTGLSSVVVGLYGFSLALTSVTPLVRALTLFSLTRERWSDSAHTAFQRASLPRRVYYLLAAVAQADGTMTAAEREAVRHFVLQRFADPVQLDELRQWEAQPLPITDIAGLAARIAPNLGDGELDSLFCWCCLVAFADGRYHEHEHAALQQVARGLGIHAARARMLFHLARAQFVGGNQGRAGAPPQTPPRDARTRAFEVLGLPPDASPEQIRRRHRELVRRFHPDAQPNLGPVAQREATERFTEIQRAYEILSN